MVHIKRSGGTLCRCRTVDSHQQPGCASRDVTIMDNGQPTDLLTFAKCHSMIIIQKMVLTNSRQSTKRAHAKLLYRNSLYYSTHAPGPVVQEMARWRFTVTRRGTSPSPGVLESTTRTFQGKMGWLPWSSTSSQSPPTVFPEPPANPQEPAPSQNTSLVPSNRAPSVSRLSSLSNPLETVKDGPRDDPRPRSVCAEFMNKQAAPLVRPLAASPCVQSIVHKIEDLP